MQGRFDDRPFVLALDFDGTVKRGTKYDLDYLSWEVSPGFFDFYDWCQDNCLVMALWTSRNLQIPNERRAVETFINVNGLDAINLNFVPDGTYSVPGHSGKFWSTGSHKMYADMYVDDLACGCPMTECGDIDWKAVKKEILKLM